MKTTDYEQQSINNIIDRIDNLRTQQGYSIYKLAQKADLSHDTLRSLYKRQSFPSIHTIYRLCEAFEIPVWQFFLFGDDELVFSRNEMKLIENYESLPQKQRELLIELSECLKGDRLC